MVFPGVRNFGQASAGIRATGDGAFVGAGMIDELNFILTLAVEGRAGAVREPIPK